MNYFVTAIGTDSGKTVASAILCKTLMADYWKPVQAGYPTDSETVRSLIGTAPIHIHPEKFIFKTPASPHAAAAIESVDIKLEDFVVPNTLSIDLIIEGAGGCLVPLNDHDFVIDLAVKFNAKVILVANLYLGSINHTLLTFEALKSRKLSVKGIIFNGPSNAESERIILHHTGLQCLLHIEPENNMDVETVEKYSRVLTNNWNG
jgi:dethiobiotin synthetase